MAFGGYTYEGFRDRADELDAQRMNVAKAFEQFKKDNPYATAQELQSYIDQFLAATPSCVPARPL